MLLITSSNPPFTLHSKLPTLILFSDRIISKLFQTARRKLTIKQEFLDNLFSIDLQASAIAFYIDGFRMEEQEYAEAATYSPEQRSQFPIQVDLRGYHIYSGGWAIF